MWPAFRATPASFLFGTKPLFEEWLRLVGREPGQPESDGSDCDVTFEGVLLVDGVWSRNIRSVYVMTEQGRIEGDIDVCVAFIDGLL